jgi:hypothetical protein
LALWNDGTAVAWGDNSNGQTTIGGGFSPTWRIRGSKMRKGLEINARIC